MKHEMEWKLPRKKTVLGVRIMRLQMLVVDLQAEQGAVLELELVLALAVGEVSRC